MKKSTLRGAAALGLSAIFAATLAGCAAGGDDGAGDGQLVVKIGNRPTTSEEESRKTFDDLVASFEKANPDIDLQPEETKYDPTAFQAQLAGGNLPDVIGVPFTDIQGLIANGQVADVTAAVESTGLADRLNPTVLEIAQSDGKTFGVPSGAYTLGLIYNRDLFEKAGLDPDSPPTTWDEVRTAAKAIHDATGVPGYSIMAQKNAGGWMFSGMTYSFGGTIENADGTETTFNDGPSKAALELLHAMRWEDGSIGENALYDYDGINQQFGSEQLGMFTGAPDMYWASVINNKMEPTHFAIGPMPQDGGTNGTLAGGTVQVVSPKASAEVQEAAVKWIDWYYLNKYNDQDVAVQIAESTKDAGGASGLPGLSVVSDAAQAEYDGWIEPYVTVPVENFAPYMSTVAELPLIPEPKTKAQDVYGALDSVIQAVLTDRNADIDQLLADNQTSLDSLLSR